MKLWLGMAIALIFFSGCSTRTQTIALQKRHAQQALLIQKQQLEINALKDKLNARTRVRKKAKRKASTVTPTKKNIKLKKVEDNNFSSGYMYPQTKSKPKPKPKPVVKLAQAQAVANTTQAPSIMGKAECIAMIGQDKFDKYTQMFGNEASSIKRCKMLKAMRN